MELVGFAHKSHQLAMGPFGERLEAQTGLSALH